MKENAVVVWITGLSGAGKTTIGSQVSQLLRREYHNTVFLDGDSVRNAIAADAGHDPEARLRNAFRLCRLALMLNQQGHHVVCATMSLFPEVWSWNRKHFPNYVEVYLRATKDALVRRDSKGIYQRAARNLERNVVGWDLPFEEPKDADLILDVSAHGSGAIEGSVSRLHAHIVDRLRGARHVA